MKTLRRQFERDSKGLTKEKCHIEVRKMASSVSVQLNIPNPVNPS